MADTDLQALEQRVTHLETELNVQRAIAALLLADHEVTPEAILQFLSQTMTKEAFARKKGHLERVADNALRWVEAFLPPEDDDTLN